MKEVITVECNFEVQYGTTIQGLKLYGFMFTDYAICYLCDRRNLYIRKELIPYLVNINLVGPFT